MKFTATSLFTAIANGSGKILQWKVYVRKVTSLSEPLNSGTAWTDVSLHIKEIPTIAQKAEISPGIPTSSGISLTAIGIEWWEANVFNATDSQYIEIKIECKLGLSETALATDIAYEFSGYVDKKHPATESEDSLTLNCFTLDDLLGKLSGELLKMQTLVGTNLFLPSVPGVFVKDANVSSYQLKAGVHTISYDSTEYGVQKAKLDEGDWITLANGDNTLSNKYTDELTKEDVTDQKIVVAYDSTIALSDVTVDQKIIQITLGDILPYTWFQGVSIRQALLKLFALIGITSSNVNIEPIKFNTFDSRKTKSFYSIPPGDGTFHAQVRAIVFDNNISQTLWLGVGEDLYTFDHDTETYTLIGTPASGWTIEKLWAGLPSEGHGTIVGILSIDSNNVGAAKKVFVYDLIAETFTVTAINAGYLQTIAFDFTNYLLFYQHGFTVGGNVDKFDIATSTESTHCTPNPTLDLEAAGFTDGTDYYSFSWSGTNKGLYKLTSGGSTFKHALTIYSVIRDGIFSLTNTMIYFQEANSGIVYGYQYVTDTLTALETASGVCFIDDAILGVAYISKIGTTHTIKRLGATTVTSEGENINYVSDTFAYGHHLTYDSTNSRYYFITYGASILGKFDSKVSAYLGEAAEFGGQKLRDAYNNILQSMMLVGVISMAKKANIYRRFDDDGDPVTSGNTLAITVNQASDISRQSRYSEAISWLQVSNGSVSWSYDGTTWYKDANYLGEGVVMSLSFGILPDNLIKDVAYYLWQYFSVSHDLYEFPLANVTPLQYECIDGASVTFSTTKIKKTASGTIMGTEVEQSGAMKVSVVI